MENTKLETTGQKHISTVADDIKKLMAGGAEIGDLRDELGA